MGGYIRPVSGNRLCKNVPVGTFTHATGGKRCCLRGPAVGVVKIRELEQRVSRALQGSVRRDGGTVQLTAVL